MKNKKERDAMLCEAANAAVRWAKTGMDYDDMRNKVDVYFQASTPDSALGFGYIHNSREIAMNFLMMKCIMPLTSDELSKLDREARDIASTLPNNVIRGLP